VVLCSGPFWLNYNPLIPIYRDPSRYYRLYSDDFAYVGASRDWGRTVGNLFVPHNTHIVPAWRVLTWALVAAAGRLENVPAVLPIAAYAVLVATMLLTGRLVARETGRASAGLAALAAVGTSGLMSQATIWYSAGQTIWAGCSVLATLCLLQGWRSRGGAWRLVASVLTTWMAGAFWTVGHVAGPVGAVYLWADGRRRCRLAAAVPLVATAASVALALALGGDRIDGSFSFLGRSTREAITPHGGASNTVHAVVEKLVLLNLGVKAETTNAQSLVLALALGAAWVASRSGSWRPVGGGSAEVGTSWPEKAALAAGVSAVASLFPLIVNADSQKPLVWGTWSVLLFLAGVIATDRANPLERAGAALALSSYYIEMVFRGYIGFEVFRYAFTWYDSIPHIGFVLFVSGWWAGVWGADGPKPVAAATRGAAAGLIVFLAGLLVLNQPRANFVCEEYVPRMLASEAGRFPTDSLRRLRLLTLLYEQARWQERHLVKLEKAEALARRMGVGRRQIREAFGRLDAPGIPVVYDAADLLDLPWESTKRVGPDVVRRALAPLFKVEPHPRPVWLDSWEVWPPTGKTPGEGP
jgi:hypothetical protein